MRPTMNDENSVPEEIRREMKETLGLVPSFMRTIPPEAARMLWTSMRDFEMSEETALDGKTKQLIGVGVAAAIPCHYCVLFHTESARMQGASEQEIQEAVFMSSLTRQGSTILNGVALDRTVFEREMSQIVEHVKKQQTGKRPVAAQR